MMFLLLRKQLETIRKIILLNQYMNLSVSGRFFYYETPFKITIFAHS